MLQKTHFGLFLGLGTEPPKIYTSQQKILVGSNDFISLSLTFLYYLSKIIAAMINFAKCDVFSLLNFEKKSSSLNIVVFIQFFALNSNMKSAFQSEI